MEHDPARKRFRRDSGGDRLRVDANLLEEIGDITAGRHHLTHLFERGIGDKRQFHLPRNHEAVKIAGDDRKHLAILDPAHLGERGSGRGHSGKRSNGATDRTNSGISSLAVGRNRVADGFVRIVGTKSDGIIVPVDLRNGVAPGRRGADRESWRAGRPVILDPGRRRREDLNRGSLERGLPTHPRSGKGDDRFGSTEQVAARNRRPVAVGCGSRDSILRPGEHLQAYEKEESQNAE